jgi:hypothetical protein
MGKVNLVEAFGRVPDLWSPRIVATLDDYDVKLARLKGEFVGIFTRKPMSFSWWWRAISASCSANKR